MKLDITVNFAGLDGQGFGAFVKDSVKTTGTAQIVIDLNALLNVAADIPEMRFKELFKETVLHEILHGIEELFNKSFDEDRIEAAVNITQQYPKTYTEYELKIMEKINDLVSETYFAGELTLMQIKTIADKVFVDSLRAVKLVNKMKRKLV